VARLKTLRSRFGQHAINLRSGPNHRLVKLDPREYGGSEMDLTEVLDRRPVRRIAGVLELDANGMVSIVRTIIEIICDLRAPQLARCGVRSWCTVHEQTGAR
jgi:hypothetical protein